MKPFLLGKGFHPPHPSRLERRGRGGGVAALPIFPHGHPCLCEAIQRVLPCHCIQGGWCVVPMAIPTFRDWGDYRCLLVTIPETRGGNNVRRYRTLDHLPLQRMGSSFLFFPPGFPRGLSLPPPRTSCGSTRGGSRGSSGRSARTWTTSTTGRPSSPSSGSSVHRRDGGGGALAGCPGSRLLFAPVSLLLNPPKQLCTVERHGRRVLSSRRVQWGAQLLCWGGGRT